jgi:RimJ/RimL family protein N-acetyltransferase
MKEAEKSFLESHTINLRMPRDEDVTQDNWYSWYNDLETTRFNSHGVFPVSRATELDIVRSNRARTDMLLMAIEEKVSGRLIGNAALYNIDFVNRTCKISLTIGEPSGISAGLEVYGLLVQHAFCRLNLNRVAESTHERLISFVRMLKIIGFEEEGRGRQYYLRDGKYSDIIYFGVVAYDFFRLQADRSGKILFDSHGELLKTISEVARDRLKA